MVPINDLLLFAGAALLMVLTPGPNMIYLILRSICQGRKAGMISLLGVIMEIIGTFVTRDYAVGVECDAPWAKATLVSADIPG